jgi:hypothetical protein
MVEKMQPDEISGVYENFLKCCAHYTEMLAECAARASAEPLNRAA